MTQDGNLRQCAVYGLGVAAQHQRAAFRQVAQPAVAALMAVIRKPGAREEDNAMATENAIGALGKVRSVAAPTALDAGVCVAESLLCQGCQCVQWHLLASFEPGMCDDMLSSSCLFARDNARRFLLLLDCVDVDNTQELTEPTRPFGAQVLEFQSDAVDSAAVAEAWRSSLPLTVDEVEAQGSHALLVRLIEQSDPRCSCDCMLSRSALLACLPILGTRVQTAMSMYIFDLNVVAYASCMV